MQHNRLEALSLELICCVLEVQTLVIILEVPCTLIQVRACECLEGPADGCDHTEHASEDVALGHHADRVDEAGGAGRGDTNEHVDREEEVPAGEEEVEV